MRKINAKMLLYIFYILHQTTTLCIVYYILLRCISFISYIKPQQQHVQKLNEQLYIFYILHQTTT